MCNDDRAVSTALGYVLTLSIATLLVTGLLVAGSGFVDDRREQVVRDELTVIGQQVSADLARADRLVGAADSSGASLTVAVNKTYPDRVTGSAYQVELDPSNDRLVLSSDSPEITISIDIVHRTDLGASTADGGIIQVAYDSSTGELVIRDA